MHRPRHALELQGDQREGRFLLQEAQRRAGLDLQRHVVIQADGARGILPRGHRQHAAALGPQLSDRRLKGFRPVLPAVGQGFQLPYIHHCILLDHRALCRPDGIRSASIIA